ncbi:MAG: GlsB/YeaQ/YmgE family stress response membrane protein [Bacteroidota bacterium]
MSILGTILIGLIAGALAKFVMPGKDGGGWVMTILLGIAGSIVATYLGSALGLYIQGDNAGLIASTLGAIFILIVYRLFKKKSA